MAIIFDEVTAEVTPERAASRSDEQAAAPTDTADPAELVRVELQRMRERAQRLLAD